VRTEHLKTKLNAVYTLTVMTSGADRWWKCELVGTAVWGYDDILEC